MHVWCCVFELISNRLKYIRIENNLQKTTKFKHSKMIYILFGNINSNWENRKCVCMHHLCLCGKLNNILVPNVLIRHLKSCMFVNWVAFSCVWVSTNLLTFVNVCPYCNITCNQNYDVEFLILQFALVTHFHLTKNESYLPFLIWLNSIKSSVNKSNSLLKPYLPASP